MRRKGFTKKHIGVILEVIKPKKEKPQCGRYTCKNNFPAGKENHPETWGGSQTPGETHHGWEALPMPSSPAPILPSSPNSSLIAPVSRPSAGFNRGSPKHHYLQAFRSARDLAIRSPTTLCSRRSPDLARNVTAALLDASTSLRVSLPPVRG